MPVQPALSTTTLLRTTTAAMGNYYIEDSLQLLLLIFFQGSLDLEVMSCEQIEHFRKLVVLKYRP